MKKILTSLFALAAVVCANAAVPTCTISPASGTELTNKAQKVVFTFGENVTIGEFDIVSGPLNQRTYNSVEGGTNKKVFNVQLEDSFWGKAQDGEISMRVSCSNVVLGTDTIKNEDGFPMVFYADYTIKDDSSAKLVKVEPAPTEVTVAEMYGTGIDVFFTAEVGFDTLSPWAPVEVVYTTNTDDVTTIEVEANEISGNWDWYTNMYYLSIPLPEVTGLNGTDLKSIEVNLYDVISNGEYLELDIPLVTYNLTTLPVSPQIKKSSKMLDDLANGVNNVSVYTLQGTIVRSNISYNEINDLPAGLYVIDGKKVAVK